MLHLFERCKADSELVSNHVRDKKQLAVLINIWWHKARQWSFIFSNVFSKIRGKIDLSTRRITTKTFLLNQRKTKSCKVSNQPSRTVSLSPRRLLFFLAMIYHSRQQSRLQLEEIHLWTLAYCQRPEQHKDKDKEVLLLRYWCRLSSVCPFSVLPIRVFLVNLCRNKRSTNTGSCKENDTL